MNSDKESKLQSAHKSRIQIPVTQLDEEVVSRPTPSQENHPTMSSANNSNKSPSEDVAYAAKISNLSQSILDLFKQNIDQRDPTTGR